MTVVLAEKPSVARDLARYLGARQQHDGYFEGSGYHVTWALGHLVCLKEPNDYDPQLKKWSIAPLPFVPNCFELKLTGDKGARKQFGVIKKLFRAADELICATDAGREGELIFRYIQQLSSCIGKPCRRLWLSSLTDEAIRTAFNAMRPGSHYDPLFHAARCRNEADWIVGFNATRNFSVRHGPRLWSVGRVQTPVLALIAARDDEIRHFKPESFWELFTKHCDVRFKYTGTRRSAGSGRFSTEAAAQETLAQVQQGPLAITAVNTKRERSLPSLLHDLTDLQREMNRRYGLAAATTLKTAQALYENKLITYPRTDSRYLSSDMKPEVPGILANLCKVKPEAVEPLDTSRLNFSSRIVNDSKVSDHHALIPTGKVPGKLDELQRKVYDAIVIRFIAAFYPPCLKDVTTVDAQANQIPFRARGVTIVDPGWTTLYPRKPKQPTGQDDSEDDEQILPAFKAGDSGPHSPYIKDGMTKPPRHYSENTLLAAMETAGRQIDDEALKEAMKEKGLGTPATRATTIELLLTREYIKREKKQLTATDAGRFLLCLIQSPRLKSAEMTGEWEAQLKEIEHGRCEPQAFMQQIVDFTRQIVTDSETRQIDDATYGSCPRCGAAVVEGKRGYGCSDWRQGCPFVLWKEQHGITFTVGQIRELLQLRLLSTPVLSNGTIIKVAMDDHGDAVCVPVEPLRPGKRHGAAKSSRPKRSGDTAKKSSGKQAKAGRSKTQETPVGDCPNCGKPVVPFPRSFSCSDWRGGCQFVIWKEIAGKGISARTATSLIRNGKTSVLKGFKSKAGKKFEAALKIDAGKVVLNFCEKGL
ncbi:MAG TPA: DNA topoisomerase III [Lentisphaeria bacterium]|nr:DNA topoisomerase III [Lentisphaeria bacterium]